MAPLRGVIFHEDSDIDINTFLEIIEPEMNEMNEITNLTKKKLAIDYEQYLSPNPVS